MLSGWATWWLDRRKHRQEVEGLKADNRQKDLDLSKDYVTDRDRIRDRSQLRDKSEKLIVKTDTVYIAVRDSVSSSSTSEATGFKIQDSGSRFVSALKWIFWILVAGAVVVVVLRFGRLLKC